MKRRAVRSTELLGRVFSALLVLCTFCVVTFGQDRVARQHSPESNESVTHTQQNVASTAGVAQDASVADKYTTVFGAKIHYLDAGAGPAVILIHGLGGSTANWAPTIAPLAQKYRVLVPDQIGFGKSDKPMLNYRVATLVDFLDGFYKQVGIQKASLVGNSLGGFTAAAFTIAHPEKVDKLVLVDAAGFAVTGDIDPKVLNGLNPSTRQQVKDLFGLVFYNKEQFSSDVAIDAILASRVTAGDQYTIQRFIDSIGRGEDMLDGKLGAIKHPTLIVWGREDGLTPLAMGQRFNKEIGGSQLFIIEKCGHVPQLEKPAEFNAALVKFLGASKDRQEVVGPGLRRGPKIVE